MHPIARRRFLGMLSTAFYFLAGKPLSALDLALKKPEDLGGGGFVPALFPKTDPSNFAAVYKSPLLRREFYGFLQNVYHLYPEEKFDRLIAACAAEFPTDEAIYRSLQTRLPAIKPFLSELHFGLPALSHQKQVMTAQTLEILPSRSPIEGYLEIGTMGRYTRGLRKALVMKGPILLMNERPCGYSPIDLVERGSLKTAGQHVPLADYHPAPLPAASLGLVTNYIGLHHAPLSLLDGFVASLARALRPGAHFILRDHHIDDRGRYLMAALAHDVFNAGLAVPWEKNAAELRHFRPLGDIDRHLARHGLSRLPPQFLQAGDPTTNTLVIYRKEA